MSVILIIFGVMIFLPCVYALWKMLTSRRANVLSLVHGNILAFISLIVWVIVAIIVSAYLIFKGYDYAAATSLRKYIQSQPVAHLVEGSICLLMMYGLAKVDGQNRLSGIKRTLVIAGGILLGVLDILLGLSKMFG